MKRNSLLMWLVLIIGTGLLLTACGPPEAAAKPKPAEIGADGRITLTSRAVERLGIQTGEIREAPVPWWRAPVGVPLLGGNMETVVPYSAVMYGLNGETWVYTSPDSLVFVRQPVILDRIEGEIGVMLEGPPLGTLVVIIGAAELFGAETGLGK